VESEAPVSIVPVGLAEKEAAVLSGVGLEPHGVDAVARRSGVEIPEVLPPRWPYWSSRELKGFVRRDGVHAYVRRAVPSVTEPTLGELWSRYF
jgi:hypothetical protein